MTPYSHSKNEVELMNVDRQKQFLDHLGQHHLLPDSRDDYMMRYGGELLDRLAKSWLTVQKKVLTTFQKDAIKSGQTDSLFLFDRYIVCDAPKAGGQAQVTKVSNTDLRNCRYEALKQIHAKYVAELDERDRLEYLDRFAVGASAAAELDHPNIAKVYHFDVKNLYFTMEFVDGVELHEPELDISDALKAISQTAEALHHAHTRSNRVLHRDIKPSNIIYEIEKAKDPLETAMLKVVDFGLAKIDPQVGPDETTLFAESLTHEGQSLGTSEFMAPEVFDRAKYASVQSDIYSLGCTMYRVLTRQPIFLKDEDPKNRTHPVWSCHHEQDPIPSIEEDCPAAPNGLHDVFLRMVAKQPHERYRSMAEVVEALKPFIHPPPPAAVTV